MTKVVYLPLDERPCNYKYPQMLASITDLNLVVPELELLGKKKKPANFDALKKWILRECKNADYLILSIDLLLYGGIVPSRLHHLSLEDCRSRLSLIQEIKNENPQLIIYAFNLITRTPSYNNNDEEPEYYDEYGESIFKYGQLKDRHEKGDLDENEINKLFALELEIPAAILNDFLSRRKINHEMNIQSILGVDLGIIDHLVIPLDDNSTYGFTSREQKTLTLKIEELNLVDQILIYPGADEVGCTLLAKVFTTEKEYKPEIYVRYSSTLGPLVTPKLEDRTLNESIKSQLTAVNAFMADNSSEADCVLMVNSSAVGGQNMADGKHFEKHYSYYSEVNHREFINAITHYKYKNKLVALADATVINGGDHQLLKLMAKLGLLEKVDAYAGWNTVGNSMGTVIAHATIYSYYKNKSNKEQETNSKNFYLYRLIEDWIYQSIVREKITNENLPSLSANYFDVKHVKNEVEQLIVTELSNFSNKYLELFESYEITNLYLPWNRMFEVSFDLDKKDI